MAQFLATLPEEDIVAYRSGDFVFTYPGGGLVPAGPDAWLVVMVRDSGVNGAPARRVPVSIASGEYSGRIETTFGAMPKLLAEQNAYRKSIGLPPSPPLETVTHTAPALAPPDP